jgi:hypothetical protein
MLEVSAAEGKSFRCRAATNAIAHDRRWLDHAGARWRILIVTGNTTPPRDPNDDDDDDDDDEDDEDQPDEPAVVREPDEERPH